MGAYNFASQYMENHLGYSNRGALHKAMVMAAVSPNQDDTVKFTSQDNILVEYFDDGSYDFFHNGVRIDIQRAAELLAGD